MLLAFTFAGLMAVAAETGVDMLERPKKTADHIGRPTGFRRGVDQADHIGRLTGFRRGVYSSAVIIGPLRQKVKDFSLFPGECHLNKGSWRFSFSHGVNRMRGRKVLCGNGY